MSAKTGSDDKVQLMVDLLKSGAVLTDLSCPACASPLFRLKSGEIWCARCQKKVIVVKEEEEAREVEALATLSRAEATIMMKIWEINEKMRIEDDPEEIRKLGMVMGVLLDNLERIRRVGKKK